MKASSTPQHGPQEEDIVTKLHRLFGMPVVFIAWPKGKKGTGKKWGHLTVADMTPEYLAKLSQGNIGVALGEKSGGLCAIDCDTDEFAESFLRSNPKLAGTLRTHGARGCAFWVRFTGDYPKQITGLKSATGKLGEFRSNGGQSIVWGIHPDTGQPYQFVVDQPVVEIDYSQIVWPAEVLNPSE